MADENSWRTNSFRQSIVAKIDEAIRTSGMATSRNSLEMENHVFQKAKSKEEYLGFVARLILHVREIKTKQGVGMQGPGGPGQGGPGMPDPINALQNLASQGSRNPLVNMGPGQMGGQQQIAATNLLQTLNRGPGQQMMMGNMPGNMSGISMQGISDESPLQLPLSKALNMDDSMAGERRASTPTTTNISTLENVEKHKGKYICDSVLLTVQQLLDSKKEEDSYDLIGKNVGNKLRCLPKDVSIVAEKLITDILFEAQIGNISGNTRLNFQNVPSPVVPITDSSTSSMHF